MKILALKIQMYKLEVFITTAYILLIAAYERKLRSDHNKEGLCNFPQKINFFIKRWSKTASKLKKFLNAKQGSYLKEQNML